MAFRKSHVCLIRAQRILLDLEQRGYLLVPAGERETAIRAVAAHVQQARAEAASRWSRRWTRDRRRSERRREAKLRAEQKIPLPSDFARRIQSRHQRPRAPRDSSDPSSDQR